MRHTLPSTPARVSTRSPTARAVAWLCAVLALPTLAQIRTDGTVGAPAKALTGPAYLIPQDLGKLSGANLFHSFQTFNIGSGESATFTTTSGGIANVISRVTGGGLSRIDGLLKLSAADGAPAFFFINPAGVTFGAGAAVDVPGAFHVSTADALVFRDGRFHADPAKASTFSAAPPEAFGFLGTQRAAVGFEPQVFLLPTARFGVTAGDVLVDGGTLAVRGGGGLRIAAVGGDAVDVPLAGAFPALSGQVTLRNGSLLATVSSGAVDGGPLEIGGGDFALEGFSALRSLIGNGATGRGGPIDVAVRGRFSAIEGSRIQTETDSAADAGSIRVRAGALQLGSGAFLYSLASGGGQAGAIDLAATGAAVLGDGASISTDAGGDSAGQGIRLQAAALTLADSAYLRTIASGRGAPGDILLDVTGAVDVRGDADVSTFTSDAARAGNIMVRTGSLALSSGGLIASLAGEQASGGTGSVELISRGHVSLASGAKLLSSSSSATGDAAPVRITAASVTLDNADISSSALARVGSAAAGSVDIVVDGLLLVRNGSSVDTSTAADGNAGLIRVRARDVTIEGDSRFSSQAVSDEGRGKGSAGAIDIAATGALTLRDAAALSTSTFGAGAAGAVRVSAGSALLERAAVIASNSNLGSSGVGGNVVLAVSGSLAILDGSGVSVTTQGSGHAGEVAVTAGGLRLDGSSSINSASTAEAVGDAGRISIRTAGDIVVGRSAFISSESFGPGRAGEVFLQARNLTLDTGAGISSRGDAGRVDITASGDVNLLNSNRRADQASVISTSSANRGVGGAISIQATNLLIDTVAGGVLSFARGSAQGGTIGISASGELRVLQGGLSATSFGSGAAGSVDVRAARVEMTGASSGLSATAFAGSGGQTGNVVVIASERISMADGATVSISNDAVVTDAMPRQPTTLRLAAPEITLRNGAEVSAASTGNVAASAIVVEAGRSLLLDGSAINTSANTGNGGPIRIAAGDAAVSLRDSVVTTSVFGLEGDGGDIDLAARTLLLESGFIQANTAARNARGGLVRIATGALVASGNTLFLGGDMPLVFRNDLFGFNVIQAAAPTGVSGVVDLSSPVLDLTGSLRALRADVVDTGGLGRSLCQTSGGSSLALAGRGGLPSTARGLQRVEPTAPTTSGGLSGALDAVPSSDLQLAGGPVGPVSTGLLPVVRGCL